MRLISWLLRALLLTILVNAVIRLFMPRQRPVGPTGGGASGPRGGGRRPAERIGGPLVRDPHCGTYIPRTHALTVGSGDDALYFCSDACRTAWRQAHP